MGGDVAEEEGGPPGVSMPSFSANLITFSPGPPGVLCQGPLPGGSGTSTLRSPALYRRWLTQSCTWNWIQAAARTLSEVAGTKLSRYRSSRLTVTGFGVSKRSGR